MTGAATAPARSAAARLGREVSHVLAGAELDGPAERLAAMLDPAFLSVAGWDPASRVLSLPAGHRLLGRAVCQVGGCTTNAHAGRGVCYRCFTRLRGQGLTAEQIAGAPPLPPLPARITRCAVPGCQREPTVTHAVLCQSHARQCRSRVRAPAIETFVADPRVRPLRPLRPCAVTACTRAAGSARGYCTAHYERWRAATRADPDLDAGCWQLSEPAVAEGGQVSLCGLPPLVVVQVLFGIWQRTRSGAKTTDTDLRAACRRSAASRSPRSSSALPARFPASRHGRC